MDHSVNDAAGNLAMAFLNTMDDKIPLQHQEACRIAAAIRTLIDAQIKAATPGILRRAGVLVKP